MLSSILLVTLVAVSFAATIPPKRNNSTVATFRVSAALSSHEKEQRNIRDAQKGGVPPTALSNRRTNATKTSPKLRLPTPRQNDEAMIKVVTEIQNKASKGQLLLLICRAHCYQQRGQTTVWLREYMNETNITDPEHFIHYYYYFSPNRASQFSIQTLPWPTEFPAFLYIIAGRAFQFGGDTSDQDAVKTWLVGMHQSTSTELGANGTALNDILNRVAMCDGHKALLLLQDEPVCPMEHWDNIARSLSDVRNLTIAHIPLHKIMRVENDWMPEAETKVVIEQRMPTVDLNGPCAHLLLLQNNAYRRYSGYVTTDSPDDVRRFAIQSTNKQCDGDDWRWQLINEQLTEIELEYYAKEGSIDRLKRKPSYVVIGATGGIAIVVLAMSIFWGLNSSSFAAVRK